MNLGILVAYLFGLAKLSYIFPRIPVKILADSRAILGNPCNTPGILKILVMVHSKDLFAFPFYFFFTHTAAFFFTRLF